MYMDRFPPRGDSLKTAISVLIFSLSLVAHYFFDGTIELTGLDTVGEGLLIGFILGLIIGALCAVVSWLFITDTFVAPFFFCWATSLFVVGILKQNDIIK